MAGLTTIPCLVREMGDETAFRLALIENVLRKDLNPIEEARAYQRMVDEGLSAQEVALCLGKTPLYISLRLNLLKLRDDIQALVTQGHLSVPAGWSLAGLSHNGQARVLREATSRQLTEAEIIRLCVALREAEAQPDIFDWGLQPVERLTPQAQRTRGLWERSCEALGRALGVLQKMDEDIDEAKLAQACDLPTLDAEVQRMEAIIAQARRLKTKLERAKGRRLVVQAVLQGTDIPLAARKGPDGRWAVIS